MRLPTPPCRLGRFELVETLGSGGFATVYRAVDVGSGRQVALKVLHPDDENGYEPDTEARFRRELRVLGQLTNPHTVMMFDWGDQDGLLFIVFELVQGLNLRELLDRHGPLDEGTVVHILRQVLESLDEAHGKGMLHRDIKPANILVFQRDGDPFNVKLLDFGIARHADDSHPSITKTGELIGTPHYMAPEQMLQRGTSARSDIYSLGIVALELLLGRSALHGFSWGDQLERLQTGYVFSAPELERITPRLRRVLSKMTAASPEERLTDARSALVMLDNLRPREVVVVESPPARKELLPWLGAGAALLIVLGVALFMSQKDPPKPPVVEPPNHPAVAEPDPEPVPQEAAPVLTAQPDVGPLPASCPDAGFVGRRQLDERIGLRTLHWHAYMPESAPVPIPLVVLLSREGTTGEDLLAVSGFEKLADEHQFAIIAMDDPRSEGIGPFIDATMERICIDPTRIFLVGQGNGGRVALEHSCEPWIAGVAVYAMRLKSGESLCPGKPVPRLMFMSTNSPMDPAEGGRGSCFGSVMPKLSIDRMEQMLVSQHRCDGVTEALGHEECHTWKTCDASTLATCHLDGGQPWPGQPPRYECDGFAPEFPVAEVVWSFFDSLEPVARDGLDAEGGDEAD